MKKGLIFLIVVSALFWGIYYTGNIEDKAENFAKDSAEKLKAPTEKASRAVHRANLNTLETSIEIFKQSKGRAPLTLKELVEKGYLSKIPNSGSVGWEYDPASGRIR
jgi:hypothetical protein